MLPYHLHAATVGPAIRKRDGVCVTDLPGLPDISPFVPPVNECKTATCFDIYLKRTLIYSH